MHQPVSQADKVVEEVKSHNTSSSTDEESIYVSPPSGTYSTGFDVTGREANVSVNLLTTTYDIFDLSSEAEEYLDRVENQSQRRQLDMLQDMIMRVVTGYDPSLPKIRILLAHDDSITLSWRVGTAYFGVSIYQNESESSWTLVLQGREMRGYISDGYLDDPDFEIQLPVLFDLLRKYQSR